MSLSPAEAEPEALLTRSELIAQLPAMSMTGSLSLEAIDPDGKTQHASVGYSSDLKAFAIMTYDGKSNITSWYPLPTRTVHSDKGFGSTVEIRYAEQADRPDYLDDPSKQTLYRIIQDPMYDQNK